MARARYKQLVDAFAADIRGGALPPGTRLPTHRELAAREGLALVTASRVYAELEAMGLISGETGRGTFVRETALPPGQGIDQQATVAGTLDLNFNYPALPGQAEVLRSGLRQLAAAGDLEALLRYQPHSGRSHERATVARHLACRGLQVKADRVSIVSGAQHGLATTVMALLKPGDVVATDALTYPGFKVVADAHGVELVSIALTEHGPDLQAFERLCRSRRVRAVYAMPTLHNPMGWVLDLAWRERLVHIARQHRLLIIEDAAYAFLAEDPPAPLAALAPELTVYVSGFSKNVATGLRVGFVVAPPAWVPLIERVIRATTWNTPGVMTALVCNWIDDGTVQRLEAEKRQDATARQALAREVLAGLEYIGHPASYFLWLPLPEEVRADQVAMALLRENVSVSTAEPFVSAAPVPHAIRLALGSVELDQLRVALERVRQVIGQYAY
ncbi:DNA-binding transcriptional regulator, MocR family, contains an aminotransferase domain [Pseudomonas chlororaphis]|uniref:aminotransferase-like domain-containing protein n=1 Tax=Pseudomonas chlororaphis TaxID=587753 RepID=UPI00087C48CF|nr:PLP-dependent aminotransferase family protein [Pseudomonas chlororaphis]AZD66180.1 Transcriptional regulator, GntR family domain [Pseudomonas chlororaphis subsp. aurantiaca]QIT22265.1 PLP-dependent aminotransferase family protein [Pseudomonas chlororaphis subsp. aurantiaca]WDH06423.1 PLP-dependent aminotransferase family protein [Pseudomonas chlororaphis]WDH10822.1 PLP-dependent aminotransferase family protein [Pseudomonas chlororaphis]SDT37957.1 DNA-binding transcriptional regulator, MocR 